MSIDKKQDGEKKFKDYKEKYGKIYLISTELEDPETGDEKEIKFVFKRPGTKDYDRFIKEVSKKASMAFKNLVLSSVVDEERQELKNTLEEYPALSSTLSQRLLKLMGASEDTNLKIL